ncbi:MAG: NACHT domain-containing protein, partial [Coleofasciculus sp. S288]|nr:NACHT domain-containing protein [Coleofasciculus sp. S288]
ETDLSHVRMHTRLLVRAREWESKECDSSFLLRGSDLEEAEQWLKQSSSQTPQPTALHQEYINASRKAETERQEAEFRLHRLTPQDYRNRQALLNKVKNYWVKGVLENSLHNRVLLNLGLEERPKAVNHPWNLTIETPDELPKPLPQLTRVIDLFDSIGEGRTLLILGEPGAGKTTTVLELARELIARAEQDIGQPIPVVLNLSSWRFEKQTIDDWLVRELNIKYQVPKQVGQTWVKKQQLLLLLDGLDEVPNKSQEACIDALNAFHQECGAEIVVTSRSNDYQALSKRLNFQSAIYLRSLTPEQIHYSLEGTDSYLTGLRTLLFKDGMLHQLAKSPLMLNIMALAYQGIAIEDLPETGFLEERRAQLFDAYIEQMFKRRGSDRRYSKTQTIHWLSWLARRMSQFSQTVFLIEGMQPNWLQTKSQRRTYYMGVKLLLSAIWGSLHVGLLANHEGGNLITFDWLDSLQGLIVGLMGALIYGGIGGLLWELVDESTNHLHARLLNGLLLGAIFGPIFGWLYGKWLYGFTYALIYGVIGVLIYAPLHFTGTIEPIDTLRWSWKKAGKYSGFGLIIGIVLTLGTSVPLIPSLIFGLMLSLIFGFEKAKEVDRKTVPNQSIWQSVANSIKLFLAIGLLTGLILGVIENPVFGLVNGFLFGVGAALLGGRGAGIVCIKHFTLRCILWRNGYIPWNYARFLDYASDRIFLQRVGGGYVFMHRLLLEHFAHMTLNRESK